MQPDDILTTGHGDEQEETQLDAIQIARQSEINVEDQVPDGTHLSKVKNKNTKPTKDSPLIVTLNKPQTSPRKTNTIGMSSPTTNVTADAQDD